jgi:fatty acid-binding protein DegV
VPRLIAAIAERTNLAVDDPIVAELGPVVGTHTGPGVLGVAYLEA